ncbi:MAG TPA: DUF4124 domain-containing protein [Gammaproteobacteria bacterium]|nr:DUF4124 domain-containing protein [Gammaproteobacteria bacterium]
MKRFGVLLLLVTVLAATGPFFIKDRNGQPLMSIRDISIPAPRLPAFSDVTQRDRTGEAAAPALYKWRDENGQWHYGRHAPAGIRAITVETPHLGNGDPGITRHSPEHRTPGAHLRASRPGPGGPAHERQPPAEPAGRQTRAGPARTFGPAIKTAPGQEPLCRYHDASVWRVWPREALPVRRTRKPGYAFLNTSSPSCSPTWITSPGPKRPARISFASGFSNRCWIARFSGRAPYTGSKPASPSLSRAASLKTKSISRSCRRLRK